MLFPPPLPVLAPALVHLLSSSYTSKPRQNYPPAPVGIYSLRRIRGTTYWLAVS